MQTKKIAKIFGIIILAAIIAATLAVTAVEVRLDAPAGGAAGQKISLGWTGPGARYDEVQVYDPAGNGGRGKVLANRRVRSDPGFAARQLTLALPAQPGRYRPGGATASGRRVGGHSHRDGVRSRRGRS